MLLPPLFGLVRTDAGSTGVTVALAGYGLTQERDTWTARVAVGIGFGWVATALTIASQRLHALRVTGAERPDPDWFGQVMQYTGLVAVVVAVPCWLWVASPSQRSLARR